MTQLNYAYRKGLAELAEGLNEWMADLEDIRDEAQECLEDTGNPAVQADVAQMDAALKQLDAVAELLETWK